MKECCAFENKLSSVVCYTITSQIIFSVQMLNLLGGDFLLLFFSHFKKVFIPNTW